MKGILWIARISATSLMLAGAVGFVAVVAAPDMAIAKNGNGNGNGGGNGNGAGKGNDKSGGSGVKSTSFGGSKTTTKSKKGGKKSFLLGGGSKKTGSKSKKGGLNLDAAGKKIKGFAASVDAAITGKKKPAKSVQKVKPTKVSKTVVDEEVLPPNHHGKIASELKGLNAAHASLTGRMNAAPNSMPGKLHTYELAIQDYSGAAQDVTDAQAEVDRLAKLDSSAPEFQPTQEEIDAGITAQNKYDEAVADANEALADAQDALANTDPDQAAQDVQDAQDEVDRLAGLDSSAPEFQPTQDEIDAGITAQNKYDQAVADADEALADAEYAADNVLTDPQEALDTLTGGRELSDEALAELHRLLGLPDPIDDDASIDDDLADASN